MPRICGSHREAKGSGVGCPPPRCGTRISTGPHCPTASWPGIAYRCLEAALPVAKKAVPSPYCSFRCICGGTLGSVIRCRLASRQDYKACLIHHAPNPMSKTARHILSVFLGLLLLGGLACGLFVAVRATFQVLASINSSLAVAIIGASATVLVAVLSVVLGKIYEARSLIQKEHREKKIPVYEDLIAFVFRVLMGARTGRSPSEQEMIEFMMGFTQRVMVWGSDEVLTAWVKWRRLATSEVEMRSDPMKLMRNYEELILAIRRDLGHRNKGLQSGDILALFINDINQYLPKK